MFTEGKRLPLSASGPFLMRGDQRVSMRWMAYGPFPSRAGDGAKFPESREMKRDFERIRRWGFNGLRLYQLPPPDLLNRAQDAGLSLALGPSWFWTSAFLLCRETWRDQMRGMIVAAGPILSHPSVELIYVANEIPADLVRWMGPAEVCAALDYLIAEVKSVCPGKLVGYANYPSTEYLEVDCADFTAFNIYLEDCVEFSAYLRRLRLLSADRPLIVSEIGLDSEHKGDLWQAALLPKLMRSVTAAGIAGLTHFTYSDLWWNQERLVNEWSFGLVDRVGREKPVAQIFPALWEMQPESTKGPSLAVIVCTHNGAAQLAECLNSLLGQSEALDEIIVVDDGSNDGTAELCARYPEVRYLYQEASGLSAARNTGAQAAQSDWVAYTDDDCRAHVDWAFELRRHLAGSRAKAVGGPNLPPEPRGWQEAVTGVAPGAATHVMLDDARAEHLPGCNLVLHRQTLLKFGGFDPRFRAAGDDVDLCWRLLDAGEIMEFCPDAIVWHLPRPKLFGYLRQQWGYGRAEALLREKHPRRFSDDGAARWNGTVYTATGDGRINPVIYHGTYGEAPYQLSYPRVQPRRQLPKPFDSPWSRACLNLIRVLQPYWRTAARDGALAAFLMPSRPRQPLRGIPRWYFKLVLPAGRDRLSAIKFLSTLGYKNSDQPLWDLEWQGIPCCLAEELHDDGTRNLIVGADKPLPELKAQLSAWI